MSFVNVKEDFQRHVVCLLGMPFDIVSLDDVITKICQSSLKSQRCIISTPNVNFVIQAQKQTDFLWSVINSDLNIMDGMPLVWISKLLGLPITVRVAGSDVLDFLYSKQSEPVIKLFFFGGEEGVAEKATQIVNSKKCGIHVSGFFDPGFTSVEKMSTPGIIDKINSSEADFLILALGAVKGQSWIEINKSKLSVPVVSHLGAALNFIAGNVKRSPVLFQKIGMEWFWRIYQEPALWKRYFHDGRKLISLLVFRVLPYYLWMNRNRKRQINQFEHQLMENKGNNFLVLCCQGDMNRICIDEITQVIFGLYESRKHIKLDFQGVKIIDAFVFAKLLILKKHLDAAGLSLEFLNVNHQVRKLFYWNCVEGLL